MAGSFLEQVRKFDEKGKTFQSIFRGFFGVALLLYFAGAIVYGVWEELDKSGWIEHNADASVCISGDWLQGEYRYCLGALDSTGKQTSLMCVTDLGNAPEHIFPVRFWGRIERPERVRMSTYGAYLSPDTALSWKCQRFSNSLKCWAED